jgi:hypothetical protein
LSVNYGQNCFTKSTQEYESEFGAGDHLYNCDTFNEMTPASSGIIRVARFFLVHDTKTGKMYQINGKCTK